MTFPRRIIIFIPMITLTLTKEEKEKILYWYEHVQSDSQHYGDGIAVFPEEQVIIDELNRRKDGDFHFTDSQIQIIADWMQRAIHGRFGKSIYVVPEEKSVYDKITRLAGDTK